MKHSDEYLDRRRDWWLECSKFVTSANYQKAVEFSKEGIKLFPNDVVVEFRHYALTCDYILTSKKNSARYKASVLKMKKCLRRLKGLPPWAKSYIKNEYYYMTKQYKKQYQLGIDEYKKTKDFEELYSVGVGAANYALELAKKNQKKKAVSWAKKSIKAWEKYFEFESDYYNPYVHYALALGILGRTDKMSTALTLAQMKSGKGAEYSSFVWVRNEIKLI